MNNLAYNIINKIKLVREDATKFCAFFNIFQYLNASHLVCPACGNIVELSWGWCPYHANENSLELKDQNSDEKLEDEFLAYLANYENMKVYKGEDSKEKYKQFLLDHKSPTIKQILESPLDSEQLTALASEQSGEKQGFLSKAKKVEKHERLLVHWTEFLIN